MDSFIQKLTRRQHLAGNSTETNQNDTEQSDNQISTPHLKRTLNLPALIFLNISCSIGSGIYVLTGIASNQYSGPFTFVSYLLAGVVCLFSAFCYAEFSSRIKSTAGSTYSFVYYSIGEFPAFIIGWLIFTGSLTSIAAVALTWSSYLNSITNNYIKDFITENLHLKWNPINVAPFSNYLDLPACLIVAVFFVISFRGVQVSTWFNNALAILNLTVLGIVSIGGVVYGRLDNLEINKYTNGFHGIIKGASIVMFAYTGFESSSYAISETKNPAKNVPASLIISIFFIMTTYCSSSLALNLIQPFDQIDPHAPYPTAFHSIYPLFVIVSIGPLISLSGTLFTSIYSTVRVAYTMANDGLLFSSLASINPHTQVPNTSTIISALVSISLVVAIDVRNLVGFTDITAFLTYSATALSLLIVRYCNDDASTSSTTPNANLIVESSIDSYSSLINEQNDDENSESELNENLVSNLPLPKKQGLLSFIRKWKFLRIRDNIFSIILLIFLTNVTYFGLLEHFNTIKTTLITLIIVTNIIFVIILTIVEQIKPPITLSFKVPLVPLIPILVIISNTYLMMTSDKIEWIVFASTLALGLPVYFLYGLRNSKLNHIISSL